MTPIERLASELTRLGLSPQLEPKAEPLSLRAATRLFDLIARVEDDRLRLECRVIEGVGRNRLALWHLLHLNGSPLPIGQWAMSADGAVCLTALLPLESPLAARLDVVASELIYAAEAYARQVHSDFDHLPFEASGLRANLLNLVRTELTAESSPLPTREEAALRLETTLIECFGAAAVVHVNPVEWGLSVGEQLIHASLEMLPFVRKRAGAPEWGLTLRCVAGVVDAPDLALIVALNALNYRSHGAAHSLRTISRNATLTLTTELPARLLGDANQVAVAVSRLAQAAHELPYQVPSSARLRSALRESLGV